MSELPKTVDEVLLEADAHAVRLKAMDDTGHPLFYSVARSKLETAARANVQALLDRIAHLEDLLQVQNAELESLRRVTPETRTTT